MINDIIVIGGGMTGLFTLHQLKKKYPLKKIILIEAKDKVGGKLKKNEIYSEWKYFSKNDNNIMDLIYELEIECYLKYTEVVNKNLYYNTSINKIFSCDLRSQTLISDMANSAKKNINLQLSLDVFFKKYLDKKDYEYIKFALPFYDQLSKTHYILGIKFLLKSFSDEYMYINGGYSLIIYKLYNMYKPFIKTCNKIVEIEKYINHFELTNDKNQSFISKKIILSTPLGKAKKINYKGNNLHYFTTAYFYKMKFIPCFSMVIRFKKYQGFLVDYNEIITNLPVRHIRKIDSHTLIIQLYDNYAIKFKNNEKKLDIILNNLNHLFDIKLKKNDIEFYKHTYIEDGMQYIYGDVNLDYHINKCMICSNFYTTLYPDCYNGGIQQYWLEGYLKSAKHIIDII